MNFPLSCLHTDITVVTSCMVHKQDETTFQGKEALIFIYLFCLRICKTVLIYIYLLMEAPQHLKFLYINTAVQFRLSVSLVRPVPLSSVQSDKWHLLKRKRRTLLRRPLSECQTLDRHLVSSFPPISGRLGHGICCTTALSGMHR